MSENDFFCKRLGEQEASALNVLHDCGLSHITVPYKIEEAMLYMAYGDSVDAESLSATQLYQDCLKELHAVRTNRFTPRIYAFYGANLPLLAGEKYGAYLKRQTAALRANAVRSPYRIINAVFSYCSQALFQGFAKHEEALNGLSSFSLLHGDLHCGNVLSMNGVYKLIDFEFMMFGPSQAEIAFLIFWKYISGDVPFPAPACLREQVSAISVETGLGPAAKEQIAELYFPLFLFLAADSLTKGKYADPIPFQKGLKSFYENTLPNL